MNYTLHIKSHTQAADFEMNTEAEDKDEAVKYFQKWLGDHSEEYPEWSFIYQNTEETL